MRRWFLLLPLLLLPLAALAAWPNTGQLYPPGSGLNPATNSFLARLATRPPISLIIAYNNVFSWLSYTGTLAKLDGLYLFETQDQPTANTNLISSSWTIVPTTSPAPTFTAYSGYVGTTGSAPFAGLFPKTGSNFFDPSVTTGQNFNAGGTLTGSVFTSRATVAAYDQANNTGLFGVAACGFPCIQLELGTGTINYAMNDHGENTFVPLAYLDEGVQVVSRLDASAAQQNSTIVYDAGVQARYYDGTGTALSTTSLEFLNNGGTPTNGSAVGSASTFNAAGMGGGLSRSDIKNLTHSIQNFHYDALNQGCSSTWDGFSPSGPCLRAGITPSILQPYSSNYFAQVPLRLKDGRLLSFTNSGAFACGPGTGSHGIYYRTSTNNGVTFSPALPGNVVILGQDDPSPVVFLVTGGAVVLPNGNIVVSVYRLTWSSSNCGTAFPTFDVFALIGTVTPNGPITFGSLIPVAQPGDPLFPPGNNAAQTPPILLNDGVTILLPLYAGTRTSGVAVSTNGGATWNSPVTVIYNSLNQSVSNPNETAVAQLPNGTVVAIIRDEGNDNTFGCGLNPTQGYYKSTATNPTVSASWTAPSQILGCNVPNGSTYGGFISEPGLAVDPTGRLMFLHRNQGNANAQPPQQGTSCGTGLAYSTDGGAATWKFEALDCGVTYSITEGGAYSYCFYDKGYTNQFVCAWNVGDQNSGPVQSYLQRFFFASH